MNGGKMMKHKLAKMRCPTVLQKNMTMNNLFVQIHRNITTFASPYQMLGLWLRK